MTRTRTDVIAGLVLGAVATLCWVPRLKGPIDLRWDGAAYYVLGTSLAEGKGYRLLNEPGNIQTTLHPPMLPAMIAVHRWLLGTNDPVVIGQSLRILFFVLFVSYVVAGFIMLRLFLPPSYSFLAAMVFALQLNTMFMSDLCFPEIPFGLATLAFTNCNWKPGLKRVFSFPLAVISYALRTIGVALLAAWIVECVFNKRFKQAAVRLAISAVPVLCWMGYVAHVESGREYQSPAYDYQRADYIYTNVSYARNMRYKDSFSPEFGDASLKDRLNGFVDNVSRIPLNLGEAVSTTQPIWEALRSETNRRLGYAVLSTNSVRFALLLLAACVVGGIGLLTAKRQYFIPLYIGFSLIAMCTTPWPGQFNRYLVPLAPFLSLCLFITLWSIAEWAKDRFSFDQRIVRASVAGALALLIFASQGAVLFALYTKWHQKVVFNTDSGTRLEYRLFFYQSFYPAADAAFDWLKGRTSSSDVFAATDPQWVYLRTGLKSVLPPFELDAGKAQRLLDSVPVKFLMVDESIYKKYTAGVVAAYPERWHRVFAQSTTEAPGVQGKFEIYERVGRP